MPDYRTMFDAKYIGVWDLAGRERTLTIARVVREQLTNGKQKANKPIVYFREARKGLAINKTNGKAIAAMYGVDTAAWVGQRITIYPTQTSFGDSMVDAIRVRPGIPHAPAAELPPRDVDPAVRARQNAAAAAAGQRDEHEAPEEQDDERDAGEHEEEASP